MSAQQAGVPIIEDVTVSVSPRGEIVGLAFGCRDGLTRTVAIPSEALTNLVGSLLWASAEAALRGPRQHPPKEMRDALREGARTADDAVLAPAPDGVDQLLEFRVGATVVCVRLPAPTA